MRRDVFEAIADPTRREIIQMLASATLHLNEVVEKLDLSRPAISKHIKILAECGLIMIEQIGRERYCKARLDKIKEVTDRTDRLSKLWDQKLQSLKNDVENEK